MKIETEKEKQNEINRDFLSLTYKNLLKNKNMRKSIIIFFIGLVFFIAIKILDKDFETFANIMLWFCGLSMIVIPLLYLVMLQINKKRDLLVNIVKIEYDFNECIIMNSYFISGSVNKTNFEYAQIKKAIDYKKGIYLYIDENVALPICKESINNIEEFYSLLKEKGINIEVC